jgi:hypothetical protein
MEKLKELLNELETKISQQEIFNEDISKSNVGWHLEHILLTINTIIEALKESEPRNYRWSFKLPRILVFTMNKIPRGRAKSPKVVVPKIYDQDSLRKHLKNTILNIEVLKNIDNNKYFNHPFFGNLKLEKAIKFLEIHTTHHLEIINDIIAEK